MNALDLFSNQLAAAAASIETALAALGGEEEYKNIHESNKVEIASAILKDALVNLQSFVDLKLPGVDDLRLDDGV